MWNSSQSSPAGRMFSPNSMWKSPMKSTLPPSRTRATTPPQSQTTGRHCAEISPWTKRAQTFSWATTPRRTSRMRTRRKKVVNETSLRDSLIYRSRLPVEGDERWKTSQTPSILSRLTRWIRGATHPLPPTRLTSPRLTMRKRGRITIHSPPLVHRLLILIWEAGERLAHTPLQVVWPTHRLLWRTINHFHHSDQGRAPVCPTCWMTPATGQTLLPEIRSPIRPTHRYGCSLDSASTDIRIWWDFVKFFSPTIFLHCSRPPRKSCATCWPTLSSPSCGAEGGRRGRRMLCGESEGRCFLFSPNWAPPASWSALPMTSNAG